MAATTLQKIQDTARRIGRLGRYASIEDLWSVTKAHGELRMCSGSFTVLVCVPQTGEVWIENREAELRGPKERLTISYSPESGLTKLAEFEASLLEQARAKAREEVINELVDRKIRRIIRAKTRGFKDRKKKRPKKAE